MCDRLFCLDSSWYIKPERLDDLSTLSDQTIEDRTLYLDDQTIHVRVVNQRDC